MTHDAFATYGGRRTRLEEPTAEQAAHAVRVDGLLSKLWPGRQSTVNGDVRLRAVPSRSVAPDAARSRGPVNQREEVAA